MFNKIFNKPKKVTKTILVDLEFWTEKHEVQCLENGLYLFSHIGNDLILADNGKFLYKKSGKWLPLEGWTGNEKLVNDDCTVTKNSTWLNQCVKNINS